MTDRIVEIAEAGARLSIADGLLRIDRDGAESAGIVPGELACLVLGHPQIQVTHPVLAELGKAGSTVVVTDDRRMPIGLLLPLVGHSTQGERMRLQAEAPRPLRKRLWQSVVKAKLLAQGRLLARLYGDDAGISELAGRVRSGDPENLEGVASSRYWPRLFADPDFRRRREGEDQNRHLNYGYAVLRAVVARAICASGLHPGLGIHHHNRYDPFPLADDLMEPFRPLVDRAVVEIVAGEGADRPLDRAARERLLSALLGRFEHGGEARTLFDLAARTSAALAQAFESGEPRLDLPLLV